MTKYSFFFPLIIFLFSCGKKDDDAMSLVDKESLTFQNYFIDEALKLILINADLDKINLTEDVVEINLDTKYSLINPTTILKVGEPLPVEKNNQTYQIYFTELSIISIQSNIPIPDEPKALAKAEYVSFDASEIYHLNIGIEIRGGWSTTFPKKSYGFEIWEDENGNTSKDLSFLNMRNDDDWILDAMYNDPLRMRNLISHRIWNEIHEPYYQAIEPDAKATVRSEYVEIFINDKYQGLYALSERADRKLLKLKKYDGEIRGEMYKGIAWGNAHFTDLPAYDNSVRTWGGFQMVYPLEEEITDWSKVYNFVDFVMNSSNQDFVNEISNKIYTENFIDYFIFLNLLRATDNTAKNINLCKYDSDSPYFYMPWDLDGTWGTQYEGNREPITDDILTNGLYVRLFDLNPDDFQNRVNDRWAALSNDQLSMTTLQAHFQSELEHLQKNAVFDREKLAWNFNYQEDDYIYMSNWMNERWNFLNDYFQ